MSTLQELHAQKELIEKQIVEAQKAERKEAITQIHALMTQHSIKEMFLKEPIKVAPKWQDPLTGKQWTGRGRSPSWYLASPATAIKL